MHIQYAQPSPHRQLIQLLVGNKKVETFSFELVRFLLAPRIAGPHFTPGPRFWEGSMSHKPIHKQKSV